MKSRKNERKEEGKKNSETTQDKTVTCQRMLKVKSGEENFLSGSTYTHTLYTNSSRTKRAQLLETYVSYSTEKIVGKLLYFLPLHSRLHAPSK